ncbi:BamA/OMP85 family outer membrane protein [Candidatus Bipolaricaulota sp. J31]
MRRFRTAVLISFLVGSLALAQTTFTVGRIEIVGNVHVPIEEILKTIGFQEGDTIDALRVKEAAKALEETGYFAQVKPELAVENETVVVRFYLVEYPLIERIELRGLPQPPSMGKGLIPFLIRWFSQEIYVSETKIRHTLEENGVKVGEVLNAKALRTALERVLKELQEDEDIATAQIVKAEPVGNTLVIEFKFMPVLGNTFSGLITVPPEEAEALVSVPVGKVGRMSQIRESYRRLLSSIFFRNVELVPELAPNGDGVILHWKLEERVLLQNPAELDKIELQGITAFPPEVLYARIGPLPEGEVTNYDVLRALRGVYDYYVREGYFMVDLVPAGLEGKTLKVKVLEGVLSKIEITGNTRTKEFVIRRILGLREGEPLTRARLFAAQQALQALGYFSQVNLEPRRADEGVELTVSVVELEKLGNVRGSFSLSPETGGLVGNLEYTQRNILGTANDVSLSLERGLTGEEMTTWSARWTSYAMPLFDRVTAEGYHRVQGDTRTLGGNLQVAYPIAYLWDLNLGFTSELRWKGEEKLPPRNVLELGLSYDSRDDPFFFPRRGTFVRLSVSKAGDFAPGVRYLSLRGELAGFLPFDLGTGEGSTRGALAQRALLAWGWDLPEEYRFELGGVNSVRGAARPLKTERLLLLNTELRVELAQGFHLALFWDLGASLTGREVKSSLGIELAARFMGTFVRLDLAWPNDRPWNWVPQFEFGWAPLF